MGNRTKPKAVYKRGRFYWHRNPETDRRESTGCTDRAAAELYHAQCQRRAADPTYAAQDKATFFSWCDEVIRNKRARKSAATAEMYEQKAGHLKRIFGDCSLSALTPRLVGRYVTQRLEEGAAQSTVYKETVVLTQVLKAAHHDGVFRVEPKSLLPLDWSNGYTPRKRALSPEEVTRLMTTCARPEHAAWIAFVVATGARLSEADRAQPSDLDTTEMVMALRGTKTKGSARSVPVLPLFQTLWDIVFDFWRQRGRAPRWPAASTSLRGIAKRAGLGQVSPNDLRRTYASLLITTGVEQGLVSRLMGHRDTTMVARVYGQVTPRQLASLVRKQLPSEPSAPNVNGTNEAQSAQEAPSSRAIQPVLAADATDESLVDGFKIRRGSPSCGFESHLRHDKTAEISANQPDGQHVWPTPETAETRRTRQGLGTNETQSGNRPDALDLAFAALRLGILPRDRRAA